MEIILLIFVILCLWIAIGCLFIVLYNAFKFDYRRKNYEHPAYRAWNHDIREEVDHRQPNFD